MFFPGAPVENALKVVESICARLARTPFHFNDATRSFSASFGIAFANGTETPESLKRRADEALYEAKRQGRGRWVIK
jgi:diguanylate cyclase (GGDEF)-like protein